MKLGNWMLVSFFAVLAVVLTTSFGWAAEQGKSDGKKAKVELPAAVAKTVKDNRPNAEIDSAELETDSGIRLYDIEFKAGKGEIEVAEDGTVMDIATIIEIKDVPKLAMEVIQKAAAGARIKQLEKSEVHAEIQKEGNIAKVVKLATPKYIYEAELLKGKETGEIQVAPDGKVVEALKWSTRSEKEKE